MVHIYVLKLQRGNYYIGKTSNIDKRIVEHVQANGSEWTKLHKPIKLVESFEGDIYDEDKFVIKYMDKYGINKVRGGSFTQVELSAEDLVCIHRLSNSANDLCHRCGRKGHFISNCFAKTYSNGLTIESESDEEYVYSCEICGCEFETLKQCTSHEKRCPKQNDFRKPVCYNCGKRGHYANFCFIE